MLMMADQYITNDLKLTKDSSQAMVIVGRKKAKKLQRFIQRKTKMRVKCIVGV